MQHLEKAVTETTETVLEWQAKAKALDAQIAHLTQSVAIATKHREHHALAASLGDANAIAAIRKARSEQHEAEQQLSDLSIALPAARIQLANAEKAAAAARHALAMVHAEKMMRQRVEAASRMDTAFAAAASAYADFERLGRELQSFPDLNLAQSGMSGWESIVGLRRIAGALPLFLQKLFPGTWSHEASQRAPLAVSEAQFWSLPPDHESKAA